MLEQKGRGRPKVVPFLPKTLKCQRMAFFVKNVLLKGSTDRGLPLLLYDILCSPLPHVMLSISLQYMYVICKEREHELSYIYNEVFSGIFCLFFSFSTIFFMGYCKLDGENCNFRSGFRVVAFKNMLA